MAKRDRIPVPALFAVATLLGLSSTAQAYWLHRLTDDSIQPSLVRLAALNLAYWYVPALLAPVIMSFARRMHQRGVRWPIQAAVHACGAFAYAVVAFSLLFGARALLHVGSGRPEPEGGVQLYAILEFLRQLDWMLVTYMFLVGLSYAFTYRRDSEAAAIDSANLQTRLVEAQFQALQRQLHPHFLFNTLNTISGLIQTDPKSADLMIDRLGDLLRMTLHTSGIEEVPLQEELEVLQKYLEIEQTRFGDRLNITMNVAPDTLDARVPNLLLQPLVENSIRHGIAPKARRGWLQIHAARKGDALVIEVRDSGDGLPPERLMALNRGVGLENTRARLEHLYHEESSFVFSNLTEGFCVTIHIPFKVDPGNADAAQQIA